MRCQAVCPTHYRACILRLEEHTSRCHLCGYGSPHQFWDDRPAGRCANAVREESQPALFAWEST